MKALNKSSRKAFLKQGGSLHALPLPRPAPPSFRQTFGQSLLALRSQRGRYFVGLLLEARRGR